MKPADLPASSDLALALHAGRQRAMALRAVKVLQYAAVDCLPEDQAVAHAVRLLRLQVAPR